MTNSNLLKTILNVNCTKFKKLRYNEDNTEIHFSVEATRGQRHRFPICGKKCPSYDHATEHRSWRGLDFGPIKIFLESDLHRVECKTHGVITERVP